MTKSEFISAIADAADLSRADAGRAYDAFIGTLTDALKAGDTVNLSGFGSFSVRPYKPYAGRNPRTGNPVPVSAKRLPFFKVGKELKELVDQSRLNGNPLVDGDGDDDSDPSVLPPGVEPIDDAPESED